MEIISSGIVAVPAGVSATDLYVIQEGVLAVQNNGWAQDIGLAEGGRAVVSNGGILYVCTVSSGGTATVLKSGYAQNVTVQNSGLYLVSSGGTAHQSLIQSGGTQIVYADVMAAEATVLDGGVLDASSGAYVRVPVVSQGGVLHVRSGALVDGARISGLVEVNSKATANSAAVFDGGKLAVLTGGYAYEAKISSGGSLDISSGGRANYALIYDGGAVMVSAGASCLNATLNGGRIELAGAIAPAEPGTEPVPGGFASNTTVNSGGSLLISSGATATKIKENGGYVQVADGANVTFTPNIFSGLILSNASATVHAGTTATDTTVDPGGKMYVSSGGTAQEIVENGGYVQVADGADVTFTPNTISGLTLSNASATVHSGTTATNNALLGCQFFIFSGGITNSSILRSNNWEKSFLYVSSGGVANNTTVSTGGSFLVFSEGIANNTTINYNGNLTVSSGGTANDITVNSSGLVYVSSGGMVKDTTVNSRGFVYVSSGGTANNTKLNSGGLVYVSSGGSANDITVNSGGLVYVSSGGIVYGALVNSDTFFLVSKGATAWGIVENGGCVSVENNADVSFLPNSFTDLILSNSTASATVHSGTTANSAVVNSNGKLSIFSGGVANDTTLNEGGRMYVSSGGVANNTTVNTEGYLSVFYGTINSIVLNTVGHLEVFGGIVNDAIVNTGADMIVSRGTVNSTTVASSGLFVNSGTANDTIVSSGGTFTLYGVISGYGIANNTSVGNGVIFLSGGTANNTTIDKGGNLQVFSHGIAKNTMVNAGGGMIVSSSGIAIGIKENGGYVRADKDALIISFEPNAFSGLILSGTSGHRETSATVHSGTTATDTIISSGGRLEVYSEGIAINTTVISGGSMLVSSAGVANNITINSQGCVRICSGGKITGLTTLESRAVFTLESAILDFNISELNPEAGARVNNLAIIQGTPVYTLTVSAEQTEGVYTLAEGAEGFNSTITVQNALGETFGTLAVGETLSVGTMDYTLNLVGYVLSVKAWDSHAVPTNPVGTKDRVSWDPAGAGGYVVEYGTDEFAHSLNVAVPTTALDTYDLPAGTYQWRVKADGGDQWADGNDIESDNIPAEPKVLQSNADGADDLFFALPTGTWENIFYAKHMGSVNSWSGTLEKVSANGKKRIANLFFGSDDANILCLTDDANGDGIFVDDEYTDLPEGIPEQQARIAQIDEIRAGAGDDIIDLTSCRIEYIGVGMTIRGGDGDDVIWANKGDNSLFGDAGNDRIVGASGNDVIAGGIGNDSMHGGGGDDIFTFCENIGTDTVEQLESGSVTLWFASGSLDNWDTSTLTYTDGDNSVKVTGITSDKVTLKFGDDGSGLFNDLASKGAFLDFTSRMIFEENDKGMLAGL